jgi:Zn-dependent alcohol dehydrogenase
MEEPRADEVRVRVVGVGVCHTDFSVRDQFYPVPLPAVLGHEASGVVEQVGRHVAKVEPGDHVVLTYLLCGTCRNCVQGKPAYCLYTFPYNFGGARLDQSTALRKGSDAIHSEVTFDMNTILFGRTVRGIIEGDSIPEIFIPRLIDLYTQGRFPFDRLIRKYQFEEINQAVQDSEQGKVFKPVLMMAG